MTLPLDQHIAHLLHSHDCVTLPGFGSFLLQQREVRISVREGVVYPPGKYVIFNRNITANDGLLVKETARCHHLAYDDALQQVQNIASAWKLKLGSGEQLFLNGIGVLQKGEEGKYVFYPLLNLPFGLSSYGLSTVSIPRQKEEEAEPTTKIRPVRKAFLRWAAILVMGIGLGAAAYWGYTENARFQQARLLEMEAGAPTVDGPVLEKTEEKPVENPALAPEAENAPLADSKAFSAAPQNNNPQPASVREISAPLYHIIAGSFRNHEAAAQGAALLKATHGVEATVLEPSHGRYRISVFSAGDYSSAVRELPKYRQSVGEDSWILKNED